MCEGDPARMLSSQLQMDSRLTTYNHAHIPSAIALAVIIDSFATIIHVENAVVCTKGEVMRNIQY